MRLIFAERIHEKKVMRLGNTRISIDLVSYHTIPHTAHMKVTLHDHHLPRLPLLSLGRI